MMLHRVVLRICPLVLASAAGVAAAAGPAQASPPVITIASPSVVEGDSDRATLEVDVSIDAPQADDLMVGFDLEDETASLNLDYDDAPDQQRWFTLPAGETATEIAVDVIGEGRPEADETFRIVLTDFDTGTPLGVAGTVTILNDDVAIPTAVDLSTPDTVEAALGQPVAAPLGVRVLDQLGQPIAGVEVALTIAPSPFNGATGTVSSPTVTTNAIGKATFTATAGGTPGFWSVSASVAGAADTAVFGIINRPPGFRVGEHLASISGHDQTGAPVSVDDYLDGAGYVVVNACAVDCAPCRDVAPDEDVAEDRLATEGLPTRVVRVLSQDLVGQPTDAAVATDWAADVAQTDDPVLHANGSRTSDLYRAARFAVGAAGDFPTYLFVAPDGIVFSRSAGALTADQIVRKIRIHADGVDDAPRAQVSVTIDGATSSGEAAPTFTGPFGSLTYDAEIAAQEVTDLVLEGPAVATTDDPITIDVAPDRSDAEQRYIVGGSTPVTADLSDGSPGSELAGFTVGTATIVGDGYDVEVDLSQARADVAGLLAGEGLTQPEIDAFLASLDTLRLRFAAEIGIPPRCDGLLATIAGDGRITGTSGADVIVGSPGDDEIVSLGGDDTICGLGGHDTIYDGSGADTVRGGTGNDIFVQPANPDNSDVLDGGGGLDHASYAARQVGITVVIDALANDGAPDEADLVSATVESVTGSHQADTLLGNSGTNRFTGRGGDDTLNGGGGNDILRGLAGADTVNGGPGADTVDGGEDADAVRGGAGDDTVLGGGGDDLLVEEATPSGADNMRGNSGHDQVRYSSRTTAVTILLNGSPTSGAPGEGDRILSVEEAFGGSADDQLTGSQYPELLWGNGGADVLSGGGGADRITGGAGSDTLLGGNGPDQLNSRDGVGGNDTLDGGPATDTAVFDPGDTLTSVP